MRIYCNHRYRWRIYPCQFPTFSQPYTASQNYVSVYLIFPHSTPLITASFFTDYLGLMSLSLLYHGPVPVLLSSIPFYLKVSRFSVRNPPTILPCPSRLHPCPIPLHSLSHIMVGLFLLLPTTYTQMATIASSELCSCARSLQVERRAQTRKLGAHINVRNVTSKNVFAHISYTSFEIQMSSSKMLHKTNFVLTQTSKN